MDSVNSLPAVQDRSKLTRDRLLDAAEEILRSKGSEAATVPAIAERAQVAVGSVYRRFSNKDAVLRSVHERYFQRRLANNALALSPEAWQSYDLRQTVRKLVEGTVCGHVKDGDILRALMEYDERHPDEIFRRRAQSLRDDALRRASGIILQKRDEIQHSDPEGAVQFVLLSIALILRGILVQRIDTEFYMGSPESLARQLTHMALAYLQNRDKSIPAETVRAGVRKAKRA